ncbi:ParB/RepB/Spo0J family partition protein [Lacipirellula limnantheis]|uniref:Nucleoid occlusion protein n=1 Tax=Lacipirellula limnantheis TaxID=2528024 RepID=A0A517U1H7_9BACT|nr:ParB/RepB/Spo0J family partition protein [Lacipirellula limnantheis]QDT74468.1 Nucleoid occlusion protein [Lacipirellula limnantheis]
MPVNRKRRPKPKSSIEERQVDELTLHPGHKIYPEPTEHEIAQLAGDMKGRGLQHPIEITPDGVIIAGQRRWLAMKKLGRSTTRCRVRYDLAEKGPHAVSEHLLADNLFRRQLSELQQARVYRELLKNSKDHPVPPGRERRDLVAAFFGRSGRKMSRLVRILETPLAVQNAYEAGKLNQVTAESVAGLLPAQQKVIAAAIDAGECPYAAIAKFIPRVASKSTKPTRQKSPANMADALRAAIAATAELIKASEGNDVGLDAPQRKLLADIIERMQEMLRRGGGA